eukprot:c20714_g1_i2 orf=390-2300(+)
MGMVLDQTMKIATGSHTQDCVHESCLSPSLGWLSPTRISFSKDFCPHELGAVGAVESISIKATASESLQYKGKERLGTDKRESMSEFEFAMAAFECDQNAANSKHMLAADELFFKGKLLPLYVPQFFSQGVEHCPSGQHQSEQRYASICSDTDKDMSLPLSSSSSSSCVALNYGALAPPIGKTKELIMLPTSPKTPRCSTKLRELLGLRKSKTPSFATIATSDASHGVMPTASKSCKVSSRSSSKPRSAAIESKSPLQTLSKAKRLFCRSDDGMNKVPEARSSTSEPLLLDANGSIESAPAQLVGCPVISFRPQHQAHHQQLYSNKSHTTNIAHNSSLCSSACNQFTRMQRSNRVSDHVEDPSTRVPSLLLHQQLRVLKEVKNKENHVNARSSTSCRKVAIKEDQKAALYRGSRRPILQAAAYYGGSGELSPARRSSGAMSPVGSSGHWSPGRHSAGALMSGYNTAGSSCRGSPGRHSISGAYSPGRLSLGVEPPMISSMEAGHGRLMRARSLERSSSYSPKSLQRKYDQMKAMRQREGWRPGLERSSSYNNMGSSVRVAPVLNVPRVCSINRSSKNNTCGNTHPNTNSSNGGGFGLGNLLFSTKNHGSSNRASAPKLQQSKAQLTSSCQRRDHYF